MTLQTDFSRDRVAGKSRRSENRDQSQSTDRKLPRQEARPSRATLPISPTVPSPPVLFLSSVHGEGVVTMADDIQLAGIPLPDEEVIIAHRRRQVRELRRFANSLGDDPDVPLIHARANRLAAMVLPAERSS